MTENDFKDWSKHPVTKAFLSMITDMGINSKLELMDYIDRNQHLNGDQLKTTVLINYSQREFIQTLTDLKGLLKDFQSFGYVIDEEGKENAAKH